jgi:branched-chain amino acid transport system permease protein
MLQARLYKLDHLYGLLLTFGLALIIEGLFRNQFGVSGQPYRSRGAAQGGTNLGFMFLPNYRAWVVVASLIVCLATWYVIENAPSSAPTCAPPPRTRSWCRPSASTCRA